MKADEFIDATIREIQAHGVTDWVVDRGHNHPRVSFRWDGGTITHVVPGTSSDWRAVRKNICDLRHQMGVKRIIHKSDAPAKKKRRTFVVVSKLPESFTVKENPLLALASLKDRMVVDARRAGRFAFHAGQSGVAPGAYQGLMADWFMDAWYGAAWETYRG